jgi:thiamine transport system permease protein
VLLSQRLSKAIPRVSQIAAGAIRTTPAQPRDALIALALLLLPPLLAVIVDGLNRNLLAVLRSPCSGRRGPRCASRWPPGCCASS